ncbi:MAG: elongation factor G [Limnochordia bacterium]|nr:elongation factor G [Limnochordia bacterium]MDD4518390.1 elongation factor G [Limnochordia bacterium]
MKNFTTEKLRNIALIGHGGTGKTTLGDALLYFTGQTSRLGKVDDGNSVFDYDPQEVRRQISISSAVAFCEWDNHKINIIDTPGFFDFVGEVRGSLRVADGAVIVVCASSGVEVGTQKSWDYADTYGTPRMILINKMDRENADFTKVLADLRAEFGNKVTPVTLPIGAAETFSGVVDIVTEKAFKYVNGKAEEIPVPAELADELASYREELMEAVAVADEDVMMKYLEGEPLTEQEFGTCLGIGTANGDVIPVVCVSGAKLVGLDLFLNYCLHCMPSPANSNLPSAKKVNSDETVQLKASPTEPLAAQVFKTMADPYVGRLSLFRVYSGTVKSDSTIYNSTKDKDERLSQIYVVRGKEQLPVDEVTAGDIGAVAKLQVTTTGDTLCAKDNQVVFEPIEFPQPVYAVAVAPKSRADEEKIGVGLSRLTEEDPTFRIERSAETKQTLVYGMGDLHLEIIASRLKDKFGVEVELTDPKVPYREAILGKNQAEGKHKKQSGGRGQYGHVVLEIEPLTDSQDFEFVNKIFGGAVPKQYVPAVEKGIIETMEQGVVAGYPVVGIRATLLDGSYHSVDSSEMAFKIAASMAFKKCFMAANPILLEPVVLAQIRVPEEYMGDIMGDMNKRRGRILGMEPLSNGLQLIKAHVPMSEMFKYAVDLRSMTQGRGDFTTEFVAYEQVPHEVTQKVIEEGKKE